MKLFRNKPYGRIVDLVIKSVLGAIIISVIMIVLLPKQPMHTTVATIDTNANTVSVPTTAPKTDTKKEIKDDDINPNAINCAKTVVMKNLKAPRTAEWGECRVLEKDKYGRYLVTLEVDAQNDYGAMLRAEYYVVIQEIKSDGSFIAREGSSIQEKVKYNDHSTLTYLKALNSWDESRNNEKNE